MYHPLSSLPPFLNACSVPDAADITGKKTFRTLAMQLHALHRPRYDPRCMAGEEGGGGAQLTEGVSEQANM